jgi:hypothetical protein
LPVIVETLQTQLTALADHVFELVQQHRPVILMSQLFLLQIKTLISHYWKTNDVKLK